MTQTPVRLPKDLLDFSHLSASGLEALLDTSIRMKAEKYRGLELAGQSVALVFEKPSLRTRTTLELAVVQLGGHALYLDQRQTGIGVREPVRDIARNLERWVAGIAARVYKHETVEAFAQHAKVPVINALSDKTHPLQALADLQTMREVFGKTGGLRFAYVGDGNNVLASLLEVAPLAGLEVRVATPKGYEPDAKLLKTAGAKFTYVPAEAVEGAQVVYTDVWTSMGQEEETAKRLCDFKGFEITNDLLDLAAPEAIFLHCLPAHYGEEVAEEVVYGPKSRVFDQAENRLHTAKAVLYHWLS
ncbi:MAG: ornithine carbamoyltransferase [Deinococcus sp.]|nr:ornithine carbamoyltransferase [Deinococcus sp.]